MGLFLIKKCISDILDLSETVKQIVFSCIKYKRFLFLFAKPLPASTGFGGFGNTAFGRYLVSRRLCGQHICLSCSIDFPRFILDTHDKASRTYTCKAM